MCPRGWNWVQGFGVKINFALVPENENLHRDETHLPGGTLFEWCRQTGKKHGQNKFCIAAILFRVHVKLPCDVYIARCDTGSLQRPIKSLGSFVIAAVLKGQLGENTDHWA
jgi:hypothetical protein